MTDAWRIWEANSLVEQTLYKRATGDLGPMEATKHFIRLLEPIYTPQTSVLDVGCGPGHYYKALRERFPDIVYLGVDATQNYITFARKLFDASHFIKADIYELQSMDGKFDIVLCCNLFQHLPNFRRALRNLLPKFERYCFIRTLVGPHTTLHQFVVDESWDELTDQPASFIYQNTYSESLLRNYISTLGNYNVEFIDGEFDLSVLASEFGEIKGSKAEATNVIDGKQVSYNLILNWKWLKISRSP